MNVNTDTLSRNQREQNHSKDLYFKDFKLKGILGNGRCGRTFLCEFYDDIIALKCIDLWKNSRLSREMQSEVVEIYRILTDIRGEYIPRYLEKYGYITEQQRTRGLCALKAIHDKDILHDDIREENIYLI
ncbi:kinase-like domain-containing protein [Rhizophagus clarus]|uniref:Kinase-like domain-containing protein n=1 Tax=Rhizophagus clarus TaxID=94130 RepID=A0A8H3MEQ2_9GLOM|nr:kinase-like domain-containing protein [Rhizophagus clarus]